MAHIALINLPSHGHTNPTLPLVAELVRRGHRVTYYSFPEFQAKVEQAGAEFRSYAGVSAINPSQPDPSLVVVGEQLLRATLDLLPFFQAELARVRPDLLLYDSLCAWGRYVGQLLALPAACSMTTFAVNLPVMLHFPRQALHMLRSLAQDWPQSRRFGTLARQLQRTYGLPRPQLPDMFQNAGDLNLVFTSAQFQPFASAFDGSYRFIGTSLEPAHTQQLALPDTRILYISLGTLFNADLGFYRRCLQAFGGRDDLHVVMSVGHNIASADLGQLPANVTVRSSVPQLEVLQRAAAFISHGGMNSVQEAFSFGVPLALVPQGGDQGVVAQRVVDLGAGVQLAPSRTSVPALQAAVETLLTDQRYRAASAALGDSLRHCGGAARGADELEQFYRRSQISRTAVESSPH